MSEEEPRVLNFLGYLLEAKAQALAEERFLNEFSTRQKEMLKNMKKGIINSFEYNKGKLEFERLQQEYKSILNNERYQLAEDIAKKLDLIK